MTRHHHDQVCAYCRSHFRSVRSDARYCSERCRKALKRRALRTSSPVLQTKPQKPPKPKSQQAHDIATAEAWIDLSHDEKPTL